MNTGPDLNEQVKNLLENIEWFVNSNTVLGSSIEIGEITLVPLIRVVFGLGTGSNDDIDTAGGGAGATLTPLAVIVIQNGNVDLININGQETFTTSPDQLTDAILDFMNKKEKESHEYR